MSHCLGRFGQERTRQLVLALLFLFLVDVAASSWSLCGAPPAATQRLSFY
jgi:hypothetical protein